MEGTGCIVTVSAARLQRQLSTSVMQETTYLNTMSRGLPHALHVPEIETQDLRVAASDPRR